MMEMNGKPENTNCLQQQNESIIALHGSYIYTQPLFQKCIHTQWYHVHLEWKLSHDGLPPADQQS